MKIDPHLKTKLRESKRILVSYTSKLGDCIHTLPALRVIRAHAPDARIYFLASDLACPLLDRCVDIDETIPMGLHHGSTRQAKRRARIKLMLRLFRSGFDVHVDFHPGLDQIVLSTLMAGIKTRVGINTRCDSACKPWRYETFSDQKWQNQLLAQFALDQLAAMGLEAEVPTLGPAYLKRFDGSRFAHLQPYIHVAPFASEGSRELAPGVLEEVLLQLAGRHPEHRIVISSAPVPRERRALDALCQRLGSKLGERMVTFPGTLDTGELAELIVGAALHAGCDSGTLHTAVLVGAPSVTWFLNHESITAWAPRMGAHTALISAAEQSRDARCIEGISAPVLFEQCERRLSGASLADMAQWVFASSAAGGVRPGLC